MRVYILFFYSFGWFVGHVHALMRKYGNKWAFVGVYPCRGQAGKGFAPVGESIYSLKKISMRRVLFFGGLALAVFSCTSGSNNSDTSGTDTSTTTTTTDGTNVGGAAGGTDTTTMNMGTDTGVGRTTTGGQDTATTGGTGTYSRGRQDSL